MRVIADTLYIALIGDPARMRGAQRLRYWCDRHKRCLLLDAVGLPTGDVILHQKRYKLSDELNLARSSADGRAKNTFDGENHWKPRTYYIDTSALDLDDTDGATLEIQCDHVIKPLTPSEFRSDWTARRAEVRVRPDGSRYAVT